MTYTLVQPHNQSWHYCNAMLLTSIFTADSSNLLLCFIKFLANANFDLVMKYILSPKINDSIDTLSK